MKVTLLEDYLIGSRTRTAGMKIDTDRELGQMLIDSGKAVEDNAPVRKKKKTNV